jgi:hypothetical protein
MSKALISVPSAALHVGARRSSRPLRSTCGIDSPPVIGLAAEFLEAAMMAAVTASMITARGTGRSLRLIGPPLDYLPKQKSEVARWFSNAPAVFFTPHMTTAVQAFYTSLNAALLNTPDEADDWQLVETLTKHDWSALAQLWIPICAQAAAVLKLMIKFDVMYGTDHVNRYLEIELLVASAQSLGTPCIRSDNIVLVPGWLDFRREVRIPINASIWLSTHNWRKHVLLKDISAVGAGLGQAPSLPVGTDLSLELPHCPLIRGAVMWSLGGHIGVRFLKRLNDDDIEFRAARSLCRKASRKAI